MADQPTDYMLTTVDNPFDPFTQFDEWLAYDRRLGHNTPSLLARIAHTSDDLSDANNATEIQNAIDRIVNLNASGVHRKVARGS